MKGLAIATVCLAACGLVFADPAPRPGDNPPVYPVIVVPPDEIGGGVSDPPVEPPVNLNDSDRDGYIVSIDCNDADPSTNPIAVEKPNGIDDNCDGVVDDGFDTTIDWPRVALSTAIWPQPGLTQNRELVSTDAQPRLAWAEDRFMAVWTDVRNRLFVARIGLDGTLLGSPEYPTKRARNADAAWTGSRLGVVYESTTTAAPSVRLMILDSDGAIQDDVVLADAGREPKIAWGQDRFGVVWKTLGGGNTLRFQRFTADGEPLSSEEVLDHSGNRAAIAFSGTTVRQLERDTFVVHEGMFGIAYEARYKRLATGDVLLSARPREAGRGASMGTVRVNQHDDPYTALGAMPTIAANASGFAVSWHAEENGLDRAQARVFSIDELAPVQEFTPDLDAARYGRLTWTGGEFVMANDNRTTASTGATACANGYDVHFRRVDPSGNTHLSAAAGPWTELNLRANVQGSVSAHPDVAYSGEVLGIAWVESDPGMDGQVGRLWFATVTHK